MNGILLIQQLRAASVVTKIIPLSGQTAEGDRQTGRAAGFNNYLFKPFLVPVALIAVGVYLLIDQAA